jgi:hypothetical protein
VETTNNSVEQMEIDLHKFTTSSYLLALNAMRQTEPLKPWMKDNRPKTDEEVYKIIQSVHGWGCQNDDGTITAGTHGHQGVERTLTLLKDKVPPSKWWYSMRQDVKQFIHDCPNCVVRTMTAPLPQERTDTKASNEHSHCSRIKYRHLNGGTPCDKT